MQACKIINLEAGMPTVEQARVRLNQELHIAKANRVSVVKIIHGYGSTGKGGAIKSEVQRELARRKRLGSIRDFVPGECFDPFSPQCRALLQKCPALLA